MPCIRNRQPESATEYCVLLSDAFWFLVSPSVLIFRRANSSMPSMTATTPTAGTARHGLLARFTSFITEKHPFALRPAVMALDMAIGGEAFDERDPAAVDRLREPLRRMLLQTLGDFVSLDAASAQKLAAGVPETTPGVSVNDRLHHAGMEILQSCDGFLGREAIAASLTPEERREILRGMILTRAVDNRLKAFFTGGEVRWGSTSFQGKG